MAGEALTYTNPVSPGYFADPFVWQHGGVYYAVGTPEPPQPTLKRAPRVFPLLRSHDFARWELVQDALIRPEASLGDDFWAPEVAFRDGTFFMYYSVGHGDRDHHLRVATSSSPDGPYCDSGTALTRLADCPFAIDPHPYHDEDGRWYLFYARDFLDAADGVRAGTALVVDRLDDMVTLAGCEQVALRARYDWQRFLADRSMYGRIFDWHTLEGPCVRKHAGRYYCFYSGGRWETQGYGVDYGVADHVAGPYSDAGGDAGPRVLRSGLPTAAGPGHASVTTGPDGRTEYLVYHAWDEGLRARRMFVDRLVWTAQGPRCSGPTVLPQTLVPVAADHGP